MDARDKLMLTADFWRLDGDQTEAFNSAGNTLVVAGPGSGKTRLLVAKAIRLALQKGSKTICHIFKRCRH